MNWNHASTLFDSRTVTKKNLSFNLLFYFFFLRKKNNPKNYSCPKLFDNCNRNTYIHISYGCMCSRFWIYITNIHNFPASAHLSAQCSDRHEPSLLLSVYCIDVANRSKMYLIFKEIRYVLAEACCSLQYYKCICFLLFVNLMS